MMLIGCGLGPLMSGALSDSLAGIFGVESLRYALISTVVFLIPAAAAFLGASRSMLQDLEE